MRLAYDRSVVASEANERAGCETKYTEAARYNPRFKEGSPHNAQSTGIHRKSPEARTSDECFPSSEDELGEHLWG